MSNFWSRLGQSFLSAGAMNARQPLLAWEASWDEAEALIASGKLWPDEAQTQAAGAAGDALPSKAQQPVSR